MTNPTDIAGQSEGANRLVIAVLDEIISKAGEFKSVVPPPSSAVARSYVEV